MKAFHDSVPVLTEMDPMKAFGISWKGDYLWLD
jgi:hypothetical protein